MMWELPQMQFFHLFLAVLSSVLLVLAMQTYFL
jgi:hypothetical protein